MKDFINILESISGELSQVRIEEIARETEFVKRQWKLISPCHFLTHLCLESVKGTISFSDLALSLDVAENVIASRQAYHSRMNCECMVFFERILAEVMRPKLNSDLAAEAVSSGRYKRILVQDSTVIQLPLRLFEVFSGVKNAHTSVCNARIQGVYDLLSGQFIHFSIDPYKKNDLTAALELIVEEGDLVLRDRGYSKVTAFEDIVSNKADFTARYKHKTTFYDIESGEPINLLNLLKEKGNIDMWVFYGPAKKLKVRLLAEPAPEDVVNTRKRNAKKDSKARTLTAEYLGLLSWSIFITSIKEPEFNFTRQMKLYQLRWRIECIFKTWKSNFNFDRIHNVSKIQLNVILCARLIMICIFYHNFFTPLSIIIEKKEGVKLSLMKFMRCISKHTKIFFVECSQSEIPKYIIDLVSRRCGYAKRTRGDFESDLTSILLEINYLTP